MRPMTYDDLISLYDGSCTKAADALGKRKQTVNKWKQAGIPEVEQLEIQKRLRGKVKADPRIVAKFRDLLRAA